MNRLDLRKENEEEVIKFEERIYDYEWGPACLTSEHWDIIKILPLISTTHNYYLAQDSSSSSGMIALYRCKK